MNLFVKLSKVQSSLDNGEPYFPLVLAEEQLTEFIQTGNIVSGDCAVNNIRHLADILEARILSLDKENKNKS